MLEKWYNGRMIETTITTATTTQFERHMLPNGLTVLTVPGGSGSAAAMLFVGAGSRYETPDTNGIAHFSEHMFFKGTGRRPTARDSAGEVDASGASSTPSRARGTRATTCAVRRNHAISRLTSSPT